MIGDEYLQTRAQLGTALFSLSTLAHSLHAGKEILQILHELRRALREPFLFAVAGEEKSGKSSLINALFGREIVPAGSAPERDKIHIYKYGTEERDLPVYEQFIEHCRSNTLLRDFNIIETPASNVITPRHLEIADQILPVADLVLFVFSVTNPWDSPSWNFLDHIRKQPSKNIVFVLQQCDLREASEVDAIEKHLGETVRAKFPGQCRVFAVSAKKAFLAKTTGTDREGLFRQSNFGALESYINDIATHSAERMEGLRSACRAAQSILREIAEKTRSEFYIVERDVERVAESNLDLGERLEQATRQGGGVQWAVAQSYERLQKRGEDLLQQGTHRNKRSMEEKLRPPIDAKLEESIPRRIQSAMELLEDDLRQTWPQIHETLRQRFPAESSPQPCDLVSERTNLLRQIERSLAEKKSPEHFAQEIPRLFAGMAEWLQVPTGAVAAGGLKAFVPALARLAIIDFYAAFSAATAMQGKLMAIGKGNRILAQFRAEMGLKREELLASMDTHFRNATGIFYSELDDVFQPLADFCARQKVIYEPRIVVLKQMEETMEKTGASLGIPAAAPATQEA